MEPIKMEGFSLKVYCHTAVISYFREMEHALVFNSFYFILIPSYDVLLL